MVKLDKRARRKRKAQRTARELAVARSKPAPPTRDGREWTAWANYPFADGGVFTVYESFPDRIRTEIPPEVLVDLLPLRWEHAGDDGAADTAVIVTAEISGAAVASAAPPGVAVFSCHSPAGLELMDFNGLLLFDRVAVWPGNVSAPEFLAPEMIRAILADPDALPNTPPENL